MVKGKHIYGEKNKMNKTFEQDIIDVLIKHRVVDKSTTITKADIELNANSPSYISINSVIINGDINK